MLEKKIAKKFHISFKKNKIKNENLNESENRKNSKRKYALIDDYHYKISTLYHEIFDNSVKDAPLISNRLIIFFVFSGTKLSEILSSSRNNVFK